MKIHGVWKEDAKTPSLVRWIYPTLSLPPSRNNTLKARRRSSPLFPTSPLFHLSLPVSTPKWENTYINTPRCKVEHCHQEPWSLLSIPRGKSKHLLSIQIFHGKPRLSYLFTPKRLCVRSQGVLADERDIRYNSSSSSISCSLEPVAVMMFWGNSLPGHYVK